jgi:hypothetical protein
MLVAILLMLAAMNGMVRLAARIYAPALVRGGTKRTWSAALHLREP